MTASAIIHLVAAAVCLGAAGIGLVWTMVKLERAEHRAAVLEKCNRVLREWRS
jgi:uncharacterized membrane protein